MNTEIVDKLIVGRVEPHIYAFETNTVPNYLKIGDTYRPVEVRLNEWRRYFKDLTKLYEHPYQELAGGIFKPLVLPRTLAISELAVAFVT